MPYMDVPILRAIINVQADMLAKQIEEVVLRYPACFDPSLQNDSLSFTTTCSMSYCQIKQLLQDVWLTPARCNTCRSLLGVLFHPSVCPFSGGPSSLCRCNPHMLLGLLYDPQTFQLSLSISMVEARLEPIQTELSPTQAVVHCPSSR